MHDEDVLSQAIAWTEQGLGVAFAVVVSTWGSSPRPVGSYLAVNENGDFAGSVSGGCIEPYVVSEAIDVIAAGQSQNLEYGVSNAQAEQVHLPCGGDIRVFVYRVPAIELLKKFVATRPITQVVHLTSGEIMLLDGEHTSGPLVLNNSLLDEVYCLHKQGSHGEILPYECAELFVITYLAPKQLIVVGAVHITQKLAPMAVASGFDVTVIEPRLAFAKMERLPSVRIIQDRSERAIQQITFNSQTAVVMLAHDPDLDDPVLHAALNSPAQYIGCLGSRRTHAKRVERLQNAGVSAESIQRIHAPIGLDIGGRSSGEIAISILAEIIAVQHKKSRLTVSS